MQPFKTMIKSLPTLLIVVLGLNFLATGQTWTEVGPKQFPVLSGYLHGTGRVQQFKFHSTDPGKMYALAKGGLFMSTDSGSNWKVNGTDILPGSSLISFCVDPINDQIIYVSTCDQLFFLTNTVIYKTTDGGLSWNAANNGLVNKLAFDMIVDPSNTQRIVIATNDGIWNSNNGGANWSIAKSGGYFTHMMQIPNSNALIAVTDTEVWRSSDFGNNWSQVNNISFSEAGADGMRVCVNTVQPNIVYVFSNGGNGVVFKSSDAANSFTKIYSSSTVCLVCRNVNPLTLGQGNYDLAAVCNPQNPNHLYVGAHWVWESNDGGLSWEQKGSNGPIYLHTDHTQLTFNPHNNSELWISTDGGMFNRDGTDDSLWNMKSNGLGSLEIWHAACSPTVNHLLSIGTQDNGELYMDTAGWYNIRGGDRTERLTFDYSSNNYVYYSGDTNRRSLSPLNNYTGLNYPFTPVQNTQIAFSKINPNISILARDVLWLSLNLSNSSPSWTIINPTVSAIRALEISSADPNIAYHLTGSQFYRINNLLSTPVVTPFSSPATSNYSGSICSVKNNVNVVYASCSEKIFRSADQGATWTNVTYNLPANDIIKIYCDEYSTDETIYLLSGEKYSVTKIFKKSLNESLWTDISGNLPTVAYITDLMMYNDSTMESKLYVSTMGRAVWSYNFRDSSNTTNISHSETESIFTVYPNPANNLFFVKNLLGKNYTIQIFNSDGKLQYEKTTDTDLLSVDCKNFSKGLYVYFISNDGKTKRGKIVISGQ